MGVETPLEPKSIINVDGWALAHTGNDFSKHCQRILRRNSPPCSYIPGYIFTEKAGGVIVTDTWFARRVVPHKWTIQRKGRTSYASAAIDGQRVYLHRLIIGAKPGQVVDHINGNGLDNRLSNLRIVTTQQNLLNRRPAGNRRFKGVYQVSAHSYRARLSLGATRYELGSFPTEKLAALAYDEKAKEVFGEFARLNFPHRTVTP